jgi:CRP-like cAMP-binding protein
MSRQAKSTAKLPADRDGNPVHNETLLALPSSEFDLLSSKLEFLQLQSRQLFHEAGQSIKSVYFLNSGLASVLSVMSDGRSVEVGLIGKEGFIGLGMIAGFRRSSARVVAQTDSTAFRIDAGALLALLPDVLN